MTTAHEQGTTFLHSVNLDDMFADPLIRQLLNLGRAWSPDYFASLDPGLKQAHHSMRDVDIIELRFKAFEYPGIPTPGAGTAVWRGSMLRAGSTLYLSAINPKPLPKEEIEYALMKSDIELNTPLPGSEKRNGLHFNILLIKQINKLLRLENYTGNSLFDA